MLSYQQHNVIWYVWTHWCMRSLSSPLLCTFFQFTSINTSTNSPLNYLIFLITLKTFCFPFSCIQALRWFLTRSLKAFFSGRKVLAGRWGALHFRAWLSTAHGACFYYNNSYCCCMIDQHRPVLFIIYLGSYLFVWLFFFHLEHRPRKACQDDTKAFL